MDLRQSEKYGKYLGLLGWTIKEIPGKPALKIFLRRLPVLGFSVGKIQRPEGKIDFAAVDRIAKENRALFIKLEPVKNSPPQKSGFLPDRWPLLPTATIKINLSASFEEILARAGKDTRYCLRQAEKNNLTTKIVSSPEDNDVEKFYRLWSINAKNRGFWIPFKKEIAALCRAFGKDAWIIFCQKDDIFLAADLIVKADDTAYYLHAASTPEGRKLLAPYKVLAETIKLAKSGGCRFLDLEGIFDERFPKTHRKWQGFTHFKESWGGEKIYFPGSFTKYYNPVIGFLFRLSERLS